MPPGCFLFTLSVRVFPPNARRKPLIAPPGDLGLNALEPRVLLDGNDHTEPHIVGAGHPPLLITRFGRGTEAIPSSAPPLGLVDQSQFAETTLDLNPGDAFTLYTDGLFGAAKNGRARSTPTQLAGMINPFAASAEALLELMLKAATPDASESRPDDVAAVVVRRSN